MIKISNKLIGENQPIFIIAEAGVNHNGNIEIAKQMINVAKTAGADAIKFQTFITDKLVTIDAPKARYQQKRSKGKNQYEMLKQLELSEENYRFLYAYCRKQGILFLSTPYDSTSAEFLNKLGVSAFKLSSSELTNLPLISQVAEYGKTIILSTGMATIKEIEQAIKTVKETGNRNLVLLHCTLNYPAAFEDINLKAISTMSKKFGLPIGYSDHTVGIDVPIAAAALGACMIEKHFTLDRTFFGPDQRASVEPEELIQMVASIRNVEKSLGDGKKSPRKAEKLIAKVVRKSIVAAADLSKGTYLQPAMLAIKRPGSGIEPQYLGNLIGKVIKNNVKKDQLIKWEWIK